MSNPAAPLPAASLPVTGRLVRALAWERKARVLAVVADGPAREMVRRHGLSGAAALLASEGLVASVLLSAQVKDRERLTVEVHAEEPAFAFVADVWAEGDLRARFRPEWLPAAERFRGFLSAIRSLDGRELYRGVGEVLDERWEAALQRFLRGSEQLDGRVRVQAELDEDGQPAFVAGLLVERFPDGDPEAFAALFDEPLRGDFKALMTGFAFGQLAGLPIEPLEARDLRFRCTCSRARVLSTLAALGPEQLRAMIEEDHGAEVSCHFCCEVYRLGEAELRGLLG